MLLWAVPAAAQTPGSGPVDPNALRSPSRLDAPPFGRRLTGEQARTIADRVQKVRAERRRHPGSYSSVFLKGATRWQVSYYAREKPPREIAQVLIDDASGIVTEAWTGHYVAWTMARGYSGAFGRKINSPFVWIPLTVLFLAPFMTLRRLRWLHLDLAMLAAFGVSLAFFNDARIETSVPLAYPPLVYLLLRALWIGLRGRDHDEPLPLLVPVSWLAIGVIFLMGFRIGLNVTNSNVIDVGFSGVIGADRIADGKPLYGHFPRANQRGDTYGPVMYEAYVPFEQALAWSGRWDDLPAAHGAAIAFDVLCVVLLFGLGRRLRGPPLGVVLAYLWVTWPFTLYVLNTNANDSLVAVLALAAVLFAGRPVFRGAMAAAGGLAKFGSLGLVPLLAFHGLERGRRPRTLAKFAAGFAVAAALACLPLALEGESLRTVYDRTVGFQASRGSPFSIWGLWDLDTLQTVWQVLAVVLAVAVAFVPRRRDVVGLCALGAAVLIALQLGVTHWFYLYLVWFFPLLAVALVARYRVADEPVF